MIQFAQILVFYQQNTILVVVTYSLSLYYKRLSYISIYMYNRYQK